MDLDSDFQEEYVGWLNEHDLDLGEEALNRWAEEVAMRRAAKLQEIIDAKSVCAKCETTVLPHLLTCPVQECPYFIKED